MYEDLDFNEFSKLLFQLEKSKKRIDKVLIIRDFLNKNKKKDNGFILDLIVGNFFRKLNKKKINISIKTILEVISETYYVPIRKINSEFNRLGDIGKIAEKYFRKTEKLNNEKLTLKLLKSTLFKISETSGTNSYRLKKEMIMKLLSYTKNNLEALYLMRIMINDLRVGVADGIIKEALANLFFKSVKGINLKCNHCNYVNLTNDICFNCKRIILKEQNFEAVNYKKEEDLLGSFNEFIELKDKNNRYLYNLKLELIEKKYNLINDFTLFWNELILDKKNIFKREIILGMPIKSMLGIRVNSIEEGFNNLERPFLADFKYDGLRMQIHNNKGYIKIFSRNLEDITEKFPEAVKFFKENFKDETFILDSEGIGYDYKEYKYLPFQEFSRRFQSKRYENVKEIKFMIRAFDILYYKGKSLIDYSYNERRKILENLFLDRSLIQFRNDSEILD